jgi:hypothetical protein
LHVYESTIITTLTCLKVMFSIQHGIYLNTCVSLINNTKGN